MRRDGPRTLVLALTLALLGASGLLAAGGGVVTDDTGLPGGTSFGSIPATGDAVYQAPFPGAETPSRPSDAPTRSDVAGAMDSIYKKDKSNLWNPSYLSSEIQSQLDRSKASQAYPSSGNVPSPSQSTRAVTGGFSSFLRGLAGQSEGGSSDVGGSLADILRQVMSSS